MGKSLAPKNGKYPVALLAGGPADRARELRILLGKRRGVLVKYHWDYEKNWKAKLPTDVDFVIYLKSMIGHASGDIVVKAAKQAGIPVVRTQHKWSIMEPALRRALNLQKATSLPEQFMSVQFFQDVPEDVPSREVEPPKTVRSVPVQTMLTVVDAELAKRFMEKDTVTLILELQRRMVQLGVSITMITQSECSFESTK